MLLGVVRDRDALVTRERADRGCPRPPAPSGAESPRSPCRPCRPRSRSRRSRSRVPPTFAPSTPSDGFSPAAVPPAYLISARFAPGDVRLEERAERALAVGQDRRLDRLASASAAGRSSFPPPSPRRRRRRSRRRRAPARAWRNPAPAAFVPSKPLSSRCPSLDSARCGATLRPRRGRAAARHLPSLRRRRRSTPAPRCRRGRPAREDDDQEDEPMQGVEPLGAEHVADLGRPLARVVVEQREHERADPGALEPVQAADDGDDQDVDRLPEVDRPGEMRRLYQTERMPANAAMKAANAKASVRCSVTL